MKLPEADWQKREGMRALLRVLDAGAGATRYVGGCVRDTMLGLEASDVDLATRLRPEEVIDCLKRAHIKVVPTGIVHGTVTAVLGKSVVEITTLRRDISTDGRRATVAFSDDWREDAARRDFTINALSADPETLDVHDYFDGARDLEARCVRFIGDPLTRIAEDHLRILRFFRFHARFGADAPDAASLDACTARANDLMALSRERIADELLKLLALADPVGTVRLMEERGIFRPVLPEIGPAGVERLHALVARECGAEVTPDPFRRLAALLPSDSDVAASVSARLRLSNRTSKRLVSAAERGPEDPDDPQVLAYRIGAEEAVDRILLSERPLPDIRRLAGWTKPRLPITGGQLIEMGLSPGPTVARTLQGIEREWSENGFEQESEAVRALARRHVDQALRDSQ